MLEANMRRRVNKAIKSLDPVSVENSAGPGTPDINFVEGWIELKQLKDWPKVADDVPIRVPKFTPQQRIWLRKRWQAGGKVFFLIVIGKDWLLFDGDVAADYVGKCNRATLIEKSRKHWPNGLNDEELPWLLMKQR